MHRQAEYRGAGERATGLDQRTAALESFVLHDFFSSIYLS
jgi:hypothetical protein